MTEDQRIIAWHGRCTLNPLIIFMVLVWTLFNSSTVFFILGAPDVDAVLQMGPYKNRVEGNIHLPRPASHLFDVAQGTAGLMGYKCIAGLHQTFCPPEPPSSSTQFTKRCQSLEFYKLITCGFNVLGLSPLYLTPEVFADVIVLWYVKKVESCFGSLVIRWK